MQLQLLKEKSWETLASVIVGVTILSLVIFWITAILSNNAEIEDMQLQNTRLHFLEVNSSNIVRAINTSGVAEKEVFYLEKDETHKNFIIHTGATAISYAYIDEKGSNVTNTGSFVGPIYLRTFLVDQYDTSLKVGNQIIKWTIRELIRSGRPN